MIDARISDRFWQLALACALLAACSSQPDSQATVETESNSVPEPVPEADPVEPNPNGPFCPTVNCPDPLLPNPETCECEGDLTTEVSNSVEGAVAANTPD